MSTKILKTSCSKCAKSNTTCGMGLAYRDGSLDCPNYQEKKPTRFDRIKAMSIEEMADYIACYLDPCLYCVYDGADHSNGYDCRDGIQKYLESEASY